MHQCSCRVIQGLNTDLCTDIEEQGNFETDNILEINQCNQNEASIANNQSIPDLKKVLNFLKLEPCGTPHVTVSCSDFILLIMQVCFLLFK